MPGDSRHDRRHQRKRSASLWRACEQQLTELDLPTVTDIARLAEHLSDRRSRPTVLLPIEMQAGPSGLWVATGEVDFIGYEANTSQHHQEHIIAHELGHMICCHRGIVEPDEDTVSLLFPDLSPSLIRDLMRRTGYSDTQEEEAEIMGSLIMAKLIKHGAAHVPGVLGGLKSALGFP